MRTKNRQFPRVVSTSKTKSRHAVRRDGLVLFAVNNRGYRVCYLFATVLGAGLFSSICALTLWICAACSLSCAVRTSIPFCC